MILVCLDVAAVAPCPAFTFADQAWFSGSRHAAAVATTTDTKAVFLDGIMVTMGTRRARVGGEAMEGKSAARSDQRPVVFRGYAVILRPPAALHAAPARRERGRQGSAGEDDCKAEALAGRGNLLVDKVRV